MEQRAPLETTLAEVEVAVKAHLTAFERGDLEEWGAHLAPNVFLIAADPDEVFTDCKAALAEMHKDFDPAFEAGLKLSIQPKAMYIGLSPNGKVAWSATPLAYTAILGAETFKFNLRQTNLLVKQDDQWSILVSHYSQGLSVQALQGGLAEGRFPAPREIENNVDLGATPLVELFKQYLTNLPKVAINLNAFAFGPEHDDQAEGAAEVRTLFTKLRERYGPMQLQPGGIRAQLAPDGEVGWVAANVEVNSCIGNQDVALPLRMLVVYQQERDSWELIQAHLSVGVPDPELPE